MVRQVTEAAVERRGGQEGKAGGSLLLEEVAWQAETRRRGQGRWGTDKEEGAEKQDNKVAGESRQRPPRVGGGSSRWGRKGVGQGHTVTVDVEGAQRRVWGQGEGRALRVGTGKQSPAPQQLQVSQAVPCLSPEEG